MSLKKHEIPKLYKPDYIGERYADNLCKKLVSLSKDNLAYKVVFGNRDNMVMDCQDHERQKKTFDEIQRKIKFNEVVRRHEIFFNDSSIAQYFKTPDVLKFNTIEKCLEYAQTLDWTNEGFVVMDKNFNRVKVKNASWLAVHHLASNHTMSYERAIEICRANEIDEVLGYFPEFKDALLDCKERYEKLIDDLESAWMRYDDSVLETRKDKAIWIQKNFRIPGVGFALIDKKVDSVQEWIKTVPVKNLVKHLGYKE